MPHVPVLIVGAGLAGLTAAALLSARNIPCLLAERRASTSRHPRARGVNPRSLELLRVIPGLEDELQRAGMNGTAFSIIIAESVTGRQFRTMLATDQLDTSALSPAPMCMAGQDRVEPILLRHAQALGADIRLATALTAFSQDDNCVSATLRDMVSGQETQVSADYLIAADGNRSAVRKALGIGTKGRGTLSHNLSILFEADLPALLGNRGFVLYYLQNPSFTGAFVSTDDPCIGQVSIEYDPSRQSPADFDAERAVQVVRAALGTPNLDIGIVDIMPWEMSAFVAEKMAAGRVFLAGDAAHTMPPTGGLGGQTAMQDAADLAWKLAMVIKGQAAPALLATYVAERAPVAALTVARQTANYVERLRPDRADLATPEAGSPDDYLGVAMGYRYRSPAINTELPDDGTSLEDPLHPTGRPGTRLAHVPLRRGGALISSFDLVGGGFVLIAGLSGESWVAAANHIAQRSGLPLATYRIGADLTDESGTLWARTGLTAEGALLIRPDGFIAWRASSTVADPAGLLDELFARILAHETAPQEHPA